MTGTPPGAPWPVELRLQGGGRVLRVAFEDGRETALDAEMLRVLSPSAEVRGHSEAERKTVGGKRAVLIRRVEPVGNYAVRLVFDDGHDTGLYSWALLSDLADHRAERWAAYEAELAAKRLSRDAPGMA